MAAARNQQMTEHYPRIRRYIHPAEEQLWMREVIRLVLHMPFDHHDLTAPVNRALEMYLRAIGGGEGNLTEGHDLETDPFPLEEANWEYVRAKLAAPGGEPFLEDFKAEDRCRYEKRGFQRAVTLTAQDSGLTGYGSPGVIASAVRTRSAW
jgi:hypothetical protein